MNELKSISIIGEENTSSNKKECIQKLEESKIKLNKILNNKAGNLLNKLGSPMS